MTVNYSTILDHMVATAREAGALTLDHFRRFRDIEIGVKGPGDFVSDADRDSETLIRQRLLAQYPWGLTGEEFAPVEGADQDHRWLVDPIDGTTNFLFGQHYTITIALRRGNETICGLVYNPVSDEMFITIKGDGAYLNGERLRVNASTDVALMCVGTGLPTPNLQLYPGAYQRLDAIRAPIGAVRVVGSAANSCAYVACGRLTGYYEETGFVDTAAGILLVQEAGGIVTDWWGRGPEFYEKTGTLIVANAATHAYLMEHLRGVSPKNPS
ncbi:inositol monophosphatase family protein [Agrobacterium tumefaciens]|uniref:inositol monophosphatase family protein n=1 Tax=Agrobacterium tumefaciens TaxID=358 RepID=UPI0021D2BE2B|nr:inositol monophosphatase [Agrobacterium tumefaciens]UXS27473.1 inositol monophosphatase [Agrobacterium tumefaciens]UXS54027.1 inositol monophosphatase [Agrobacterium tumefaciens]UXS66000.1 inositol monophosphatase [Agrobacterium tumefaciens]